jgi:hypothetical protein
MSVTRSQGLPAAVFEAVKPVFDKLPLEKAMTKLVVPASPNDADLTRAVEAAVAQPAIASKPALQSALWLYIDELDRSHVISQGIDTPTGSYWHGIMHRREGDFSNSHHWFRKTGSHPAIAAVEGYDPHKLIDAAEAAHKSGDAPESLIAQQRAEWANLFVWTAKQ